MVAARQRMYLRGAVHGEGSIISGGSFVSCLHASLFSELSSVIVTSFTYTNYYVPFFIRTVHFTLINIAFSLSVMSVATILSSEY